MSPKLHYLYCINRCMGCINDIQGGCWGTWMSWITSNAGMDSLEKRLPSSSRSSRGVKLATEIRPLLMRNNLHQIKHDEIKEGKNRFCAFFKRDFLRWVWNARTSFVVVFRNMGVLATSRERSRWQKRQLTANVASVVRHASSDREISTMQLLSCKEKTLVPNCWYPIQAFCIRTIEVDSDG